MKRLLLILAVTLALTSCDQEKTAKEVTEKTEIPLKITNALKDTTLKLDTHILENDDNFYIIKRNEKKEMYIDNVVKKEYNDLTGALVIFVILTLILFFMAIAFANN
jgi:uncharacterized membrane protein